MLVAATQDRTVLHGWLACGGVEALLSYGWCPGQRTSIAEIVPEAHWRFLSRCRTFFEIDTHFFVHAGYEPDLPLDCQPAEALRWRLLDRRKARPHFSGKTAIVGHTTQRSGKVLDLGFVQCIDTGCHHGQWLTALEVHSGTVWQANEQGELRRQDQPRRPSEGKSP
jgi:serine/threonine protein phosphatase 1